MATKNQSFSADAYVYSVMLEYLQPFELATLTGAHTPATYHNAMEHGSIEYLTEHKSIYPDLPHIFMLACVAGQLDSIRVLSTFGPVYQYRELYQASGRGQDAVVKLLVELGPANINDALGNAAYNNRLTTTCRSGRYSV